MSMGRLEFYDTLGTVTDINGTRYFPVMTSNDFTKIGETPVQEGYANSIVVNNGYLYYADYIAKKVIKFDANTLTEIGETPVQGGHANSIVVNNGYLYYADYIAKKVIKFDAEGEFTISHYTKGGDVL